jgi:CheY-like chemotaxis protein
MDGGAALMDADRSDRCKKVIVVVEDHEATAELIAEYLNEEPEYEALTAGDATAALELIHAHIPDLILLDVRLPGIGGFELYDTLQADPATRDIPVIFITTSASRAISADLEQRHIEGYVSKPFELEYLLSRVQEVLRQGNP